MNSDYVQRTESDVSGKTGWNPLADNIGAAEAEIYSEEAYSFTPNIDTYESINGYPPTTDSISIGQLGESWKTAVVANRRAFLLML